MKLGPSTLSTLRPRPEISASTTWSVATCSPAKIRQIEYRICTTWREPVDPELTRVLEPCAAPGTFDGYPTKRYRLRPDVLWPDGGRLIWNLRKPSVAIRRVDLVRFSERLVIELECPQISRSLASPGALERLVLEYLSERIGVGRYPNQHSRVTDVAARLIIRASHARARQETLDPSSLVAELELALSSGRGPAEYLVDAGPPRASAMFRVPSSSAIKLPIEDIDRDVRVPMSSRRDGSSSASLPSAPSRP